MNRRHSRSKFPIMLILLSHTVRKLRNAADVDLEFLLPGMPGRGDEQAQFLEHQLAVASPEVFSSIQTITTGVPFINISANDCISKALVRIKAVSYAPVDRYAHHGHGTMLQSLGA